MARPRKPQRKRGNTPAYERRDARARALGYENYYDYRLHDNGRLPPGPIEMSPAERARRRGHRGRLDFLRSLGEGDLIIMPYGLSSVEFDDDARGGEGAYVEIVKLVIDGDTGADRTYILRNLTRDELADTIEEEERRGVIFSPAPSLDQRRLVRF
jgi:hypothetical protein